MNRFNADKLHQIKCTHRMSETRIRCIHPHFETYMVTLSCKGANMCSDVTQFVTYSGRVKNEPIHANPLSAPIDSRWSRTAFRFVWVIKQVQHLTDSDRSRCQGNDRRLERSWRRYLGFSRDSRSGILGTPIGAPS